MILSGSMLGFPRSASLPVRIASRTGARSPCGYLGLLLQGGALSPSETFIST